MMALSISIGDVIATCALALSAYATWKTFKFNERQNTLIESQERLNELLLEKEAGEVINVEKADLDATLINLGSDRYRLTIWNKGKSVARNVSLDCSNGMCCLIQSTIDPDLPLEILESHHSVDVGAFVKLGSQGKHSIKLTWSDDFREHNEKVVSPTI